MTDYSHLAPAPAAETGPVKAWVQTLVLPTYEPAEAERNPMFLEKRVFQGSSGRVYPLPFIDRVESDPVDHEWTALFIENDYLRVIVLPEIGGRIYAAIDKVNGYDIIYRNQVIKPALVGLAGPWVSGGIEFNWPQHHRPSTYMPTDWTIEEGDDGSRTVWLSEHEPMNRMKGMHGIQLKPDVARFDVLVRLYNRTSLTQTIMWWANAATEVHEHYQSFFPGDVNHVADHAKRAMISFPHCDGHYYGVNYGERAKTGVPQSEAPRQFVPEGDYAPNDMRWYANIPVPTSYMCVDTTASFFGGYDHATKAGLVHVADRHISPGKKQWTWGNHEFGYAWDRNLTDPDDNGIYRPYIELMAGVYTDNQPDFAFIAPGETKVFVQHWYGIRDIGPADQASSEMAISVALDGRKVQIGLHAVVALSNLLVQLKAKGETVATWSTDADPTAAVFLDTTLKTDVAREDLELVVLDEAGMPLLQWGRFAERDDDPTESASEPAAPEAVVSVEELYLTGLHLSQYRHATRAPEAYWREALKRDPMESRCNNAMGLWHFRRGEFETAETYFRKTLKRLRTLNPNPIDGEAFYNLGLTLRYLGLEESAYDAFGKASWNIAFIAQSHMEMAEIDARRGDWTEALTRVEIVLLHGSDNLRARNFKAFCLRSLGCSDEADAIFRSTLALDPLDYLARDAMGQSLSLDPQILLDLSLDYARMGHFTRAFELTSRFMTAPSAGAQPMAHYYAAYFADRIGQAEEAAKQRQLAQNACSDYCFPCRLEEIAILSDAIKAAPDDPMAPYYLGNLFYDKKRYEEAIALWEQSVALQPAFSIPWRNLGIAYHNIRNDTQAALDAFDKAFAANPHDACLLYERDQLWKRIGETPQARLVEIEANLALVGQRDALTIEYAALLNQTAQPDRALTIIENRNFQPWEGGEGMVLDQFTRAWLLKGQSALRAGDATTAFEAFEASMTSPENLGEARHLLANQSDAHYWAGMAYAEAGDHEAASQHWESAANFKGDFQSMEVRAFSEKTYYSILSMRELDRLLEAESICDALEAFAQNLLESKASIDYFATSLPTMLIFEDDIQLRQNISAYVMLAQVALARGQKEVASSWLDKALEGDPNHALATELYQEVEGAQNIRPSASV
ncbi:Tetratricopeptide repeat-containing protein [Cohaesibacter sp. ES.047]|uniref:DUF5107 domain-containing protein n=1 Tax=Cohaesibacter sp. ES.047 TaxID=1798205 RepID=UPI000BB79120|nr:DUF5107 domain-containing protein [Cohaesibacter sp. ES.047]SNY93363.1 Tetratricopeptide repeat-containing protein [Cohaesibacter sp. ES.047]